MIVYGMYKVNDEPGCDNYGSRSTYPGLSDQGIQGTAHDHCCYCQIDAVVHNVVTVSEETCHFINAFFHFMY